MFGFSVLNTAGDETTLTGKVVLKHAVPNATYTVEVVQGNSVSCVFPFARVGEIKTRHSRRPGCPD